MSAQTFAAPSPFPGSDLLGNDGQLAHSGQYIQNYEGEHCNFSLYEYPEANFFHDSLTAITRVLEFDDSSCMEVGGVQGTVNISSINQRIARDFGHSDADWNVRPESLKGGSLLQVRGQCIQSGSYPDRGVAVAYVMGGEAITHVVYTAAVQGCK